MTFSSNKRAFEGDVVQLLKDLPQFGAKRGQRGVVITSFEKPEGYDLELSDELGEFAGVAYSVEPTLFANLSRDAFLAAMQAVERMDLVTTERNLKIATDLRPEYIGAFVMSVLRSVPDPVENKGLEEDVSFLIPLLRLASRVDPDYAFARLNLAVAFLNFGVAKARKQKYDVAIELFYSALNIKVDDETELTIRKHLVIALTHEANELIAKEEVVKAFALLRSAFSLIQDEVTRMNLGLAYGNLGVFYMRLQRFDFALEQFERAEDSGVVLAEFINARGVCLVNLRKLSEAGEMFNRVLQMDPKNTYAQLNLKNLKRSESLAVGLETFRNEFLLPHQGLSNFETTFLTWRTHAIRPQEFALA